MKWKRLSPWAIGLMAFVGCYVLTVGIVLLLDRPHPTLALWLVSSAVPAIAILVVRRTRRRGDLSPKQKAVLTGFLAGTAVGLPVAVLMFSSPAALLFLGLPTSLLAVLLDLNVVPIRVAHTVLQLVLFNPCVLFALNSAIVGAVVGWMISVGSEAPAGTRWPLARRRLALALGFLLGPALGFGAGVGLMYQYDGLAGWRKHWGPLTCSTIVSNEWEAIRGLHAIAHAQESYRRLKGGNTYARSFKLLHEKAEGGIKLIDQRLAEANHRPRAGYLFLDIALDEAGKPIDPKEDFAVCAFPIRYKRSGRNTFFVASEGTVYMRDAVGPMVKVPKEAVGPMVKVPWDDIVSWDDITTWLPAGD